MTRVLFDGEAFLRHSRSGITRYFTEMLREFETDPGLGVEVATPFRFVANQHLAEYAGRRFVRVPLPRQFRFQTLAAANRRRAIPPVDLVHHSIYEPAALELLPGTKRVCTVYDFTTELYPELFPGWERNVAPKTRFLEECDGLLCISQTTYDDLLKIHGDPGKPVIVTPLGVGPQFFVNRPAPLAGFPGRYLLHVGIRHANKNVELLFRAFAAIAGRHPELRLVLSGSPLTAHERTELNSLGIADRVIRVKVSDAQLPALYANAVAFVFPSVYEGFGLPAIEAMATGCPTVVADTPALREVTDQAAASFDPRDAEALAGLLDALIDDEGRRQELSRRGREQAQRYTWRATAEATAAAYRRVLTES